MSDKQLQIPRMAGFANVSGPLIDSVTNRLDEFTKLDKKLKCDSRSSADGAGIEFEWTKMVGP